MKPNRPATFLVVTIFAVAAQAFVPASRADSGSAACDPVEIARSPETVDTAVSRGKDVVVLRRGTLAVLGGDGLATVGEILLHDPRALAVDGDLAFVASGTRGIEVVALADPAHPRLLGEFYEPEGYDQIVVAGGWACTLTLDGRLDSFDLSDPLRPARCRTGDVGYREIRIQGDRLYLLRDGGDLFVSSLRDPLGGSEPVLILYGVGWFLVSGSTLFTHSANLWKWTAVWDLVDPSQPRQIASFENDYHYLDVTDGEILALSWANELMLWRISNPSEPELLGTFEAGRAFGFHGGGLLVELDPYRSAALARLDVDGCRQDPNRLMANFDFVPWNPAVGEEAAFFDRTRGSPKRWRWNFGDGSGSTEQNPRHAWKSAGPKRVELEAWNDAGRVRTARVVDVRRSPDRDSVDFSWSPSSPAVGERVRLSALSAAPVDSWKWTTDDGRVLDGETAEVAWSSRGSHDVRLAVRRGDRIREIEKSVPVGAEEGCRLLQTGGLRIARSIDKWVVSPEGLLYLVGDGKVRVVDLSAPDGPRFVPGGETWAPTCVGGIGLDPERKLLAIGAGGVYLYDVSNPAHPSWLSFYAIDCWFGSSATPTIGFHGTRMYVADSDGNIEVADVSDPRDPKRIAEWTSWRGNDHAFAIEGRWLYAVPRTGSFLEVFDLECGPRPFPVGRLELPSASVPGLAVDRGRLVVAVGNEIVLVDSTDPFAPRIERTVETEKEIGPFVVGDGRVWLLDSLSEESGAFSRLASLDLSSGLDAFVTKEEWGGLKGLLLTKSGLVVVRGDSVWRFESIGCDHSPSPVTANFVWSPPRPTAGEPVAFFDRSTGTTEPARWRFEEAGAGVGPVAQHRFALPGTYSVTLDAGDPAASVRVTKIVDIGVPLDPPSAAFSWRPGWPRAGSPTRLVDESTPPDGLLRVWQQEGGWEPIFEPSPEITFPLMGIYEVELHVRNSTGQAALTERLTIHHPTADCEPVSVDFLGNWREPFRLHRDGTHVVASFRETRWWGLASWDVTDPAHPIWENEYCYYDSSSSEAFIGVAVSGGLGFVAVNVGVRIIDLYGNGDQLALIPGKVSAVVASSAGLVTVVGSEMRLYSLEDPTAPRLVGTLSSSRYLYLGSMAMVGNLVAVVVEKNLQLVEVARDGLRAISSTEIPFKYPYSQGIALSGSRVALADLGRIFLVDISDRQHPTLLGSTDLHYVVTPGSSTWSRIPRIRFDETNPDVLDVVIKGAGLHRVSFADSAQPKVFSASPRWETYDALRAGPFVWLLGSDGLELVDAEGCPSPKGTTGWAGSRTSAGRAE
jgi:PKD repeat protein